MKQPVEYEHFELDGQRMALFRALPLGSVDADGHVSSDFSPVLEMRLGWKRKDISRLVLAAKTTVEVLEGIDGGKKNGHLSA